MTDPCSYRPAAGSIPDGPWRLSILRPARPGHLRRQGEESALAAEQLLRRPGRPTSAHPGDGDVRCGGWIGSRSAPRSRRCSWSTPGSRSTTRASTQLPRRQVPPFLAVTLADDFPGHGGAGAKKGTRYFGPYAHAWAIRETMDLLLRVFGIRTCSNGVFRRARRRSALSARLHRQCSAPCVGRVDAEQYERIVDGFCHLHGRPHRRR